MGTERVCRCVTGDGHPKTGTSGHPKLMAISQLICFHCRQPECEQRGWVLTVQAEGDVDLPDVGEALAVGDLGTLEQGGGGNVAHVDPTDGVVAVNEVHGRGLPGGHGEGLLAAQWLGLDALGVGDEEQRSTVHGHCTRTRGGLYI